MAKKIDLESYMDTIVLSLLNTINESVEENQWTIGTYTRYFSPDGNSSTGKFRFTLSNGEISGAVPERSTRNLISDTWDKMFKKSKKNLWYGFKLSVFPDGKHSIEYYYDPNCINDPNFVDW